MGARDTLYYDGRCGLCTRSVRTLRALDWLGHLEYADMHEAGEGELPVSIEEAGRGLPMRTSEGRVLVGYPAMRRALRRTPVGFLPALVMYVPGISHVGRRVYAWIAAHRRTEACAVNRA